MVLAQIAVSNATLISHLLHLYLYISGTCSVNLHNGLNVLFGTNTLFKKLRAE